MRVQLKIVSAKVEVTLQCLCGDTITQAVQIPLWLKQFLTTLTPDKTLTVEAEGTYLCADCSALVHKQLEGAQAHATESGSGRKSRRH